jgi:Cys-tRNA(Pro)/Cys-tRNA(Cys) deacylase
MKKPGPAKTNAARMLEGAGVLLAVIPGNAELDLKALAAASGNKKVELVPVKDILGLTGYVRGGVSLDSSAAQWPVISVSAGIKGRQLLLAPDDLRRAVGAVLRPVSRPDRMAHHARAARTASGSSSSGKRSAG